MIWYRGLHLMVVAMCPTPIEIDLGLEMYLELAAPRDSPAIYIGVVEKTTLGSTCIHT